MSPSTLEYLVTSSMASVETHDARARTAVLLGDAQAEQVGLRELVEDVLGVLARRVDLSSAGLDLVLGESAHALSQFEHLGREFKVHTQQVTSSLCQHCGVAHLSTRGGAARDGHFELTTSSSSAPA